MHGQPHIRFYTWNLWNNRNSSGNKHELNLQLDNLDRRRFWLYKYTWILTNFNCCQCERCWAKLLSTNTHLNACIRTSTHSHTHSFHWHVQNATILCSYQEFLPFLSVMYFFLQPFSTNYTSILSHIILPSISWSTSQSSCSQIHT